MNIHCPHCRKIYRVDPARVPAAGVRTRCQQCNGVFTLTQGGVRAAPTAPAVAAAAPGRATVPGVGIAAPEAGVAVRTPVAAAHEPGPSAAGAAPPATGAATAPTARPAPATPATPATPAHGGALGTRNPDARARRIARALVSDIIVYNPERRDRALAGGTLRAEFKDEILKSWKEYVDQVGEEMARSTPHFRNALNDLLARGNKVF